MTLFEIAAELKKLDDFLTESEGELSPDSEKIVDDWFASIQDQESSKLDGYVNLILHWEGQAEIAAKQSDLFAKKSQVRWNAATRLRERMKQYMELTGKKKIELDSSRSILIKGNGGNVPVIIMEGIDPEKLPEKFITKKIYLNKEAVRSALDSGDPEAQKIGKLGDRGTHLRIT